MWAFWVNYNEFMGQVALLVFELKRLTFRSIHLLKLMPPIPVKLLASLALILCMFSAKGQEVQVASQPAASGGVLNVCAGSSVLFSNATSDALIFGETTFIWTVNGDTLPNASSGPVPFEFEVPGTYEVTLEVVTFEGEVDLGVGSLVVEVGAADTTR